jgi:hypothetical protein
MRAALTVFREDDDIFLVSFPDGQGYGQDLVDFVSVLACLVDESSR